MMLTGLRFYLALGALFGALIGGLWIVHLIRDQGRAEVRSEIETQNKEAEDGARKARSAVRACYDDGGMWDTPSGECVRR